MATRTHTHRPRHAACPQHTNRVTTSIIQAIGWVWADHDDRIPNIIQTCLWFVALAVLFLSTGLQR